MIDERYAAIKAIINEWDPEGLIAIGAPDDEYDVEINSIAWSGYRIKDAETAAQVVREVFDHYFWPHTVAPVDEFDVGESEADGFYAIGVKVYGVFEQEAKAFEVLAEHMRGEE